MTSGPQRRQSASCALDASSNGTLRDWVLIAGHARDGVFHVEARAVSASTPTRYGYRHGTFPADCQRVRVTKRPHTTETKPSRNRSRADLRGVRRGHSPHLASSPHPPDL